MQFYVIVLGGFFSLAALFRLLGSVCSSFDIVARLASFIITLLILYSGQSLTFYWIFLIADLCRRLPHPSLLDATMALLDYVHKPLTVRILCRNGE